MSKPQLGWGYTAQRWEVRRACQLHRAGNNPDSCPIENSIPEGRKKWQAKDGLWALPIKMSGAEFRYMSCLLDHSNIVLGYTWVTQETISRRTHLPVSTVKNVAASCKSKGLTWDVIRKTKTKDGQWVTRKLIYVNWVMLLAARDAMKAGDRAVAESRKQAADDATGDHFRAPLIGTISGPDPSLKMVPSTSEGINPRKNPRHEMTRTEVARVTSDTFDGRTATRDWDGVHRFEAFEAEEEETR